MDIHSFLKSVDIGTILTPSDFGLLCNKPLLVEQVTNRTMFVYK